jgi:hypothetical protein
VIALARAPQRRFDRRVPRRGAAASRWCSPAPTSTATSGEREARDRLDDADRIVVLQDDAPAC